MTQREFTAWREFHKNFPFDDFHRIHRPAALIAAADPDRREVQKAIDKFTDWLQPDPRLAGFSDADRNTLAALGEMPPIRG